MTATSYAIDFGEDHLIGLEMEAVCEKLGLRAQLSEGNVLTLDDDAVTDLRRQPEDANGGISDDEDNVPTCWMYGYAYPVVPVRA